MTRHGWLNALVFGLAWLIVVGVPLNYVRISTASVQAAHWYVSFGFQFAALAVLLVGSQLVYRSGRSSVSYLQALGAGVRFAIVCGVGIGLFVIVTNSLRTGLSHMFGDPADDTVAASLALITIVAGLIESLATSFFVRK